MRTNRSDSIQNARATTRKVERSAAAALPRVKRRPPPTQRHADTLATCFESPARSTGLPPALPAPLEEHADAVPATKIEFKLTVASEQAAALAAALDRLGPVKTSRLRAHYFDTPDDRLALAGISLRLREQDGRWRQTLQFGGTGPGAVGSLRRAEHEVEVEPATDGTATPTIDLAPHHGTSIGTAVERLLTQGPATAGEAATAVPPELVERYGTRIVRRSVRTSRRGCCVDLALDQGHIEAGPSRESVCELRLELKSGRVSAIAELVQHWQRRHALWLQPESKADRGRRLACGEAEPAVVRVQRLQLPVRLSDDRFVRSVFGSCLDHILPNMAAVAAGSVNADHVHQLRVGLRRLRTALRELNGLSDAMPRRIEQPLGRVFAQLGEHRDRESVLEAIKPKLLSAGAGSVEWMVAHGAPVDLQAAVRDPVFQGALIEAAAFALSAAEDASRDNDRVRRRLRKPLRRLHRQVADGGRHFKGLSKNDQHAVRKRLKRLRYLSEFAAPLFSQSKVDRYLADLRPMQDALGEYNDALVAAEVAGDVARRDAPTDNGARFAVHWLKEARKTTAGKARKMLQRIDDAPRFWR